MTEKSCETIWKEWQSLVNMAPAELQEWLKTDARRSVEDADDGESTGHQSGRRIVEIMEPMKLETQINQLAGVVTVGIFAHRPADVLILGTEQGPEIIEP